MFSDRSYSVDRGESVDIMVKLRCRVGDFRSIPISWGNITAEDTDHDVEGLDAVMTTGTGAIAEDLKQPSAIYRGHTKHKQ